MQRDAGGQERDERKTNDDDQTGRRALVHTGRRLPSL